MERVDLKTSQLLLASYLARYFPVEYADFEITIGRPNTAAQIRRYQRRVKDFLAEHDFDILALSCWTSLSYKAAMETARICRELYPDKLVVVGGYHATAKPDEFITADQVIDYVICGEGELALKEIADGLGGAGRPSGTKIIRAPTFTLEHFTEYDWSLVDDFVRTYLPKKLGSIYIYLSRGCPFGCSFCMEPLKDRQWRAFDPEKSVEEVHNAVNRYHAFSIGISDACFGMRPQWRKDFLRRLVDSRPEFWVVFETRPEYLDEDDAGLISNLKIEVQFGIESCSPDMLILMKKTRHPQKFLQKFSEISRILSDHKVLHRANLIFNHPGETVRTLEETFAFIDKEIERKESYLIWAAHGYMHFPGCELDTNMKYYEERFGSRFLRPRWWHEDEDQYKSSMQFIPSKELDGDGVNRWERMLEARKEQMKVTLSHEAFRFAAQKYFLDWKYDPRFK
jgi:radical SAM superfamily enzyme YgiQ (UPF0313 family)